MSATETVRYVMNPAEDTLIYGDELADGMSVLLDDWTLRSPHGYGEDEQLRQQRFRTVTRLRHDGTCVNFIGEWVDGFQHSHRYAMSYAWIVKRNSMPGAVKPAGDAA